MYLLKFAPVHMHKIKSFQVLKSSEMRHRVKYCGSSCKVCERLVFVSKYCLTDLPPTPAAAP